MFAAKLALLAFGLMFCAAGWAAAPAAKKEEIPAIHYQFAVFPLQDCGGNPLAVARDLVRKNLRNFKMRAPTHDPAVPHVEILFIKDARATYPPPDAELIQYFGRGLTEKDAQDLQNSKTALVLNFSHSKEHALTGMRDALAYTERLASHCKGLIWDDITREIFTPAAWHEKRIQAWAEDGPEIAQHTVIHAYKNTEFIRAVTLGMQKFHLPDLVINDFVWSNNHQMGDLINLIGQTLLEGGKLEQDLSISLNIGKLRNKKMQRQLQAALMDNAAAEIKVPLKMAQTEEGDANNLLLEVDFSQQPGNSVQERQQALLSKIFGSKSAVVYVNHSSEIEAASALAREKLPQLAEDFKSGLQPGEYIYLKAAFATPDGGREWMWFEVVAWEAEQIRGILQNEPRQIATLKAGSAINITQAEVFDYIRYFPDGSSEGNETGTLIEKAAQKSETIQK